ncbi:50S ribosomal protein L6 [Candidatus Woesebacteria bacterium RIFCSPLOWO2_01_FULL_39_61]|uniref:Large ribosomal subunit protein uL6 n=2 Tax=Microgenomates group TaxID=1794810 RepID=A0A0H4T8Z5_9BACT|nr:50S ribosomal protein L6, large subunit ribosomal protein L6 [uncultured Microgenomates bacterium Rifle_16ft_4_minimus_37836]OGM28089.1 MAG: 50S ribosomal protein L6 [Candidatus Woesebacteria bacterium RIFCSPHIGHO2_01_FULL_39_95]OGM34081.1 MAG: 50S ribosomal protein L6 [Candidatus Woesebacteria bacterium RIFCSPHIGHO2_02_FULL_39_13]OGM38321.1 MAG: 50S ribosomal protein L6 [Candidatus Woesebacteria bacterium RIFCSPHIGHO2_12_FULL_40_20]OGM67784.1 MAG: 50S ribosomal protein L6 [Candidatus Woeseb
MSKIGKLPIQLPEGVTVEVEGKTVKVIGPKGTLKFKIDKDIEVQKKDNFLEVITSGKSNRAYSLHGTTRALIANMVKGVSEGWSKQLELVGTGYRAETSGNLLTLSVGFSHPVKFEAPSGISFKVEKSIINVEGVDKELVGQISAKIRSVRPPEPYKGKGIKYQDEYIRRKAGKAAKAQAA